ncbi:MAG: M48 family metalloprotease [Acidobacteria bacterium]|nr:M48 family metalloprotease [Acidobacteriota bacterium]MBV9625868.1 M48 family metalloprotease [Acidobacteriota bacterium]
MRLRLSCLVLFALVFSISQGFSQSAAPKDAHLPVKSYHDHSIRDLDAIGNRNVGCGRGLGNWYSLERQIAMGRDYSAQVESTSKMIRDSQVTEYINRIGQNLVRNSDSQVPFTIKVIDSDDINAFALPGGFFYVDSGLILAAESEAELAGVMAHEIAHVAACHAARGHTRGQLMNLASIPLMMVGGPIGYVAYESLSVAMPLTYLRFSRRFESEADFLGVQYMYKAGYDPQALSAFFEKIRGRDKRKQTLVAKAFETHPQTPERIEKTQAEINTLLPPQTEYRVDTSDFQEVKARLNQVENRLRIERSGTNRPTLRRRSQPPSTDAKSDSGETAPSY